MPRPTTVAPWSTVARVQATLIMERVEQLKIILIVPWPIIIKLSGSSLILLTPTTNALRCIHKKGKQRTRWLTSRRLWIYRRGTVEGSKTERLSWRRDPFEARTDIKDLFLITENN